MAAESHFDFPRLVSGNNILRPRKCSEIKYCGRDVSRYRLRLQVVAEKVLVNNFGVSEKVLGEF